MTEILDELRLAHYITTLDLSKAYLQIPLTLESRERTAFVVPGRGLLQLKRMPYGLTNTPATFPTTYHDIIIVTSTFEKHLDWLRQVLHKIRDSGLTINHAKCEFCCAEVRYLGFVVNRNGCKSTLIKWHRLSTTQRLKISSNFDAHLAWRHGTDASFRNSRQSLSR